MKLSNIPQEARDFEFEIDRYEALACQEHCKNRNTYLYYMWSYTHKLLKLTKPNTEEIEYNDKAPYPALEGDDITVGDVILSDVGSKVVS